MSNPQGLCLYLSWCIPNLQVRYLSGKNRRKRIGKKIKNGKEQKEKRKKEKGKTSSLE